MSARACPMGKAARGKYVVELVNFPEHAVAVVESASAAHPRDRVLMAGIVGGEGGPNRKLK